jgi:hypothetical protein
MILATVIIVQLMLESTITQFLEVMNVCMLLQIADD